MLYLKSRSAPLLRWQALLSLPVAGFVIGLTGPFASYIDMGFWPRIAHFVLCVTTIGSAALVVSYFVARRFFQGYWPLWAALLVDLALVGPGAAIVYASLSWFAPNVVLHVDPAHLLWQNLLVGLIFRALSLLASWRRIGEGRHTGTVWQDPVPNSAFNDRLPFPLRSSPVLALSSEDHYLRVHTPSGEALIHMTLAAAMELRPDGFQIHRSHWIAREGLKSATGVKVELITGLCLPLSRHRSKAFQEWLRMISRHSGSLENSRRTVASLSAGS
jgi:LytTr DNA-binding domain